LPGGIASFWQENRFVHSSSTARSTQAFMSG
jgi:hypothetical protein